jgi:hypothetical protein
MDKQQRVREILMKYTCPIGKYDGVNAWTIAGMILEAIEEEDIKKAEALHEVAESYGVPF